MNKHSVLENIDWYLLVAVLILCGLGFLNLYSATAAFKSKALLKHQIISFSLGLFIMGLILFFDYSVFSRFAYFIYGVAIILLVLVLFKGHTAQGSQRWLSFGLFKVQVSDLAKVALIIVISKWYASNNIVDECSLKDLFKPFVLILIPFVLILKQPDLGTSIILLFIAGSVIFFGRLKLQTIIIIFITGLISIPITWNFVLKDYQKKRAISFIDPMSSPRGAGYNVIQSMIAVGSGKFFGKGYRKGTQTSLHFLPEHHTDFIFSAWAEEHGFMGSLILIFIYFFIFMRVMYIASMAKNKFGLFLVVGAGVIYFWYFFININMVVGLMPVVGIPLPFFSYGGTSMVVNFILLGIVLNVYARRFSY
jgi:rod shape determining protein RodA